MASSTHAKCGIVANRGVVVIKRVVVTKLCVVAKQHGDIANISIITEIDVVVTEPVIATLSNDVTEDGIVAERCNGTPDNNANPGNKGPRLVDAAADDDGNDNNGSSDSSGREDKESSGDTQTTIN